MFLKSITHNGIVLALFALLTAGMIVFTQFTTQDRIEQNVQRAIEEALFELVPKERHNNLMLDDKILLAKGVLSNRKERFAYFAFLDQNPVAVILPATAPDGYGGEIQIIVAVNFDGSIAGVRVVPPHNETPGLGDGIEIAKSDWILGFNNLSLKQPQESQWAVKKDGGIFDQMTGATITPRAIVKAVYASLKYFEFNQTILLEELAEQKTKASL